MTHLHAEGRLERTSRLPATATAAVRQPKLRDRWWQRMLKAVEPLITHRERSGLREALAACRAGDTLVVTKLDRLARSLPDARAIADELTTRQISLSLGGSVYDPTGAVGRLLFNVLAIVAEFEADLIRLRTKEGMKVARAEVMPARQAAQAEPSSRGAPGRPGAQR